MNTIEIRELCVLRGGRPIFGNLNLDLMQGKCIRIIGPNGCGKSTFLKTLAGRITVESGHILYRKTHINPQHAIFLDHQYLMKEVLTVAENLSFWASIYRAPKETLNKAYDGMGLFKLLNLPFSTLSAGQKKRVQLALLFLKSAPIWLLDEPMLSLDSSSNERLAQMVENHLNLGGIVFYASHEPLPQLEDTIFDLTAQKDQKYVPIAA